MTYIDYYLVTPTGTPDFDRALQLVRGNDDAEYFVEELTAALRDRKWDPEDLTEALSLNGQDCLLFQHHNGVGDGGSRNISNAKWFAATYPTAFAALAVAIAWSKGPLVLAGQIAGQV